MCSSLLASLVFFCPMQLHSASDSLEYFCLQIISGPCKCQSNAEHTICPTQFSSHYARRSQLWILPLGGRLHSSNIFQIYFERLLYVADCIDGHNLQRGWQACCLQLNKVRYCLFGQINCATAWKGSLPILHVQNKKGDAWEHWLLYELLTWILLCSGGSDWQTIQLLRIKLDTGDVEQLDDKLAHVKFSNTAWTHDNKVHHLVMINDNGLHMRLGLTSLWIVESSQHWVGSLLFSFSVFFDVASSQWQLGSSNTIYNP